MKIKELVEIRVNGNYGSSYHLADKFGLLGEIVDKFEDGYYMHHDTNKRNQEKLIQAYGEAAKKYLKKTKKSIDKDK